jgi:hypothetical protein
MKIVYDVTLMQPGCVLLQAALGGTVPRERFAQLFDTSSWLVAPTPDLQLYPVTEEQLEKLSTMTKKAA